MRNKRIVKLLLKYLQKVRIAGRPCTGNMLWEANFEFCFHLSLHIYIPWIKPSSFLEINALTSLLFEASGCRHTPGGKWHTATRSPATLALVAINYEYGVVSIFWQVPRQYWQRAIADSDQRRRRHISITKPLLFYSIRYPIISVLHLIFFVTTRRRYWRSML